MFYVAFPTIPCEVPMNIPREWATPLTTGAFLLSAATGLLLFFHLDTGLNKAAHEWLSWVFLLGVGLHMAANFGGLKRHLQDRRGQATIALFVLLLALSFIPIDDNKDGPPFVPAMRALASAPLSVVAQVGGMSYEGLRARLEREGLNPTSGRESLADLVGPDLRRQTHILGAVLATPR